MTAVKHGPGQARSRSAWMAVVLTPIVWLVVIAVGFASDTGTDGTPVLSSVVVSLVSAAAPAAALVLGISAARAGDRSGRIAAVVSAVLLVTAFAFLPVIVIDMGVGWVIAMVVVVAALGVLEWRSWHKPLPPAT